MQGARGYHKRFLGEKLGRISVKRLANLKIQSFKGGHFRPSGDSARRFPTLLRSISDPLIYG